MEIKEKMLNDDPSMTVRIHETSVSSELDKNYKTKGKKSLSDFKCIKINEDNIKQFKELKHLRIKNCDGYMYLDGDNLVCFYNTEHKDNGEYWIQAIEVLPLYKNYSLGTQLLKKCESLGANRLSVNKSNKVAINMYKKNDWKEYDSSDNMIFMSKGTIKESYLEESVNQADQTFFNDFKNYAANIKDIDPLSVPEYYISKKKNEKWLLLATLNGGPRSKKEHSSLLSKLQKNVKYNGEEIEFHTCYFPGDMYIFIKLPNGGK